MNKLSIVVLGDGAVGKTSLLKMYHSREFDESLMVTMGIDYVQKPVTLNKEVINVRLWDTAGQERYRTLTHSFYAHADGIILVYDITDIPSFDNTLKWMHSIEQHS